MRSKSQFGFREEKGTTEPVFISRHIVERYKSKSKPVYCAFIDFKKAYDSIHRDTLWASLKNLGIHGEFLASLKAMYGSVKIQVRVGGKLSKVFEATMGVKQGDPLSPLLFGLFIDRLEQFFRDKFGDRAGVYIASSVIIQILLYADDLVLWAETPRQLQDLLDCLAEFCKIFKMKVNAAKSEIVVFNKEHDHAVHRWFLEGKELPMKSEFSYLSTKFSEGSACGGVKHAFEKQKHAAERALHTLWKQCHSHHIHNIRTMGYLFDSLIKPILNYGCEVWAPDILVAKKERSEKGRGEKLQNAFIRQCTGVRESSPLAVVLYEVDRRPIWHDWVKRCVRMWNKTLGRSDADLTKIALSENVRMALKLNNKVCWAYCFLQILCSLGVLHNKVQVLKTNEEGVESLSKIDEGALKKALDKLVEEHWKIAQGVEDPRSVANDKRDGFKSIIYKLWMHKEDQDRSKSYIHLLNTKQHITTFARFRLRSHNLNAESMRMHGCTSISRSDRVCRCCGMKTIEDEMHFMLECTLYQGPRQNMLQKRHMNNTPSSHNMQELMNGSSFEEWIAIAEYISTCESIRKHYLESLE